MMETVLTRRVEQGVAETVARALEDFKARLVTISIKEVPAKQPKPPKEELRAVFISASGRAATEYAFSGSAWPSPYPLPEGEAP